MCRDPFIHQANYAVIMFEQHAASGDKYMQLHVEATDMAAVLNNGNYSSLLGFVQGNLVEVSSFAQARPAPPVPEEPRTTFNADLNFDAPAGDRPNFYMTIAAPSLVVSTQKHACVDVAAKELSFAHDACQQLDYNV